MTDHCPMCHALIGVKGGSHDVGGACPNYWPLRDALGLFMLDAREQAALVWLAGSADGPTREALVSLFLKATAPLSSK